MRHDNPRLPQHEAGGDQPPGRIMTVAESPAPGDSPGHLLPGPSDASRFEIVLGQFFTHP